jgi:SAM-dependent methyltransferase
VRERGSHRVLRCRRCAFVTLRTGLDEARLGERYDDYLPTAPDEIARWEREQRPVIARAVKELSRLAPGRRLLEVGAGYGFFLAAARAAGFEVQGLEPSATGRSHARARFGLELLEGPLERAGLADAGVDVLCAFYVIEHLPHPRDFLAEAARVLAPGGLVFLRWPHTTPLARALDLLRVDHDLYHAPWHLSDFAPETMERALEQTGFERVATRTFGGSAPGGFFAGLLSRGAAALSDALEVATRGSVHLPGVSKTTFGFRRPAAFDRA